MTTLGIHLLGRRIVTNMQASKKILVVDDHPLVAQASKQLLANMKHIQVVGIAGSANQCIALIPITKPDLVLLDYQLPDQSGIQLAETIKKTYPQIHIVIFTGIDISDLYNTFIELRVSGIISKESSEESIVRTIDSILDGHTVIPLSLFHQMRVTHPNAITEDALTQDEVHIMTLVVQGLTHDQIALQIHISKRSVDNYLKKIYSKLGVSSKVQAIEKFIQSKPGTDALRQLF
jgi:two-component system competent response regulator ComA